MIYFLTTYIIGFIWITRDIIRVPENFYDSWFSRFAGHMWIDPQMSWRNQYYFGKILAPIVSLFSDLFHTLGTLIILIFFTLIVLAYLQVFAFSDWWHPAFWIIGMFITFGLGVYTGQWLWRVKLNN